MYRVYFIFPKRYSNDSLFIIPVSVLFVKLNRKIFNEQCLNKLVSNSCVCIKVFFMKRVTFLRLTITLLVYILKII